MTSSPELSPDGSVEQPLIAVSKVPNKGFREPGKYIASGTPEEDDPAIQARIEAAQAGGVPADLAEVKFGLRNPYVGGDVPFAPGPGFDPVPIGHVRGEPGVLSGQDRTRIDTENAQQDPNAIPLNVVRAKYFGAPVVKTTAQIQPAKTELSEANAKNRFDLLNLHRTYRLPFVPSTREELDAIRSMLPEGTTAVRLNPTLGSKYIDTARAKAYEDAKADGKPGEVAEVMSGATERAILHQLADFVEDAQDACASVTAVRTALREGKYGDKPLEGLLLQVFSKDDKQAQETIIRGVVAMIQHRDIKRLRDDAIEPPFNLLDSGASASRRRPGASIRMSNRYSEVRVLDGSDEMLEYVLAEAFEINSIDSVLLADNTIANHATREKFFKGQMTVRLSWVFPLLGVISNAKKVH